jgi:hypothetical protein
MKKSLSVLVLFLFLGIGYSKELSFTEKYSTKNMTLEKVFYKSGKEIASQTISGGKFINQKGKIPDGIYTLGIPLNVGKYKVSEIKAYEVYKDGQLIFRQNE